MFYPVNPCYNLSWPRSQYHSRNLFQAPPQLIMTLALAALCAFALDHVIRRIRRVTPHQIVGLGISLLLYALICHRIIQRDGYIHLGADHRGQEYRALV
jgi:hypothetical protein